MSAAASEALLARKERLAGEVARRFYDARPDLAARTGPEEKERLRQDVRETVEELAPALGLEDPELFLAYVREGSREHIDGEVEGKQLRLLELIRDVLDDQLPGPFLPTALECLRLGLEEAGGNGSGKG